VEGKDTGGKDTGGKDTGRKDRDRTGMEGEDRKEEKGG